MSPQDRDIKKLKKFIKSCGLKLYTRKYNEFTGSAEYVSGESITLFVKKNTSKTEIILSLLHELGHHLDWIENSKIDKDTILALNMLIDGPMVGVRKDIPKKFRKKILQTEKNGIKYMSKIYKELKLEIPFYKVRLQQFSDLFDYECLYEKARFPTNKEYYHNVHKKVNIYRKKYGKRFNF